MAISDGTLYNYFEKTNMSGYRDTRLKIFSGSTLYPRNDSAAFFVPRSGGVGPYPIGTLGGSAFQYF